MNNINQKHTIECTYNDNALTLFISDKHDNNNNNNNNNYHTFKNICNTNFIKSDIVNDINYNAYEIHLKSPEIYDIKLLTTVFKIYIKDISKFKTEEQSDFEKIIAKLKEENQHLMDENIKLKNEQAT